MAFDRHLDLGAVRLALATPRDKRGHFGQLRRVDHGPHVDAFVERIAKPQAVHAGLEFAVEPIRDAFLHEETGSGAADLALIEPDCIDKPFDGRVDIGILKHDEGGFAAKLERQSLARPGGRRADLAANLGRAGEGDLVDAVMCDDHFAHRAIAGHDIHDPFGQAGLIADIGKQERGNRGLLGGFKDDRIAHGERWGDLPREHQEREIPRDDLAADAKCLAPRQFALHQLGHAGVVVEMTLGKRHVDVAALADRFAVVEGLQNGK